MADIDDLDDEEERKRRSAASAPEFSYETIAADVWTAVYYGIPLGAGPDLLRHAHGAAMQCAGAVAGPPGLSMHAFEPMQGELGADKSREENFEHAVRRLDELDSRLRSAILDDEAERQAAPEKEQAAEKEPMTIEAIERDTWNAVDLDIPADADRVFLATVALAAEHCEKFAGAAARVGQVMEPELVEFYQERQTAATDRRDEAWRQFTVRAPEQGSETRLLNPEQMQDRGVSSLHEQAHGHREAAGQGAEITHEALDKNPWVVLTGVLAEFDDRALLDRIDGTLHELRDEATQRRAAAGSPEEAELWRVVAGDAESRGREAREEIANLTARESADEISRPLDAVARLRELENERDSFVVGAPDGTETHDPEEWRLQNPEDAEELAELAAEQEQRDKAQLAEEILVQQGDMHSHYDIGPWQGGVAVFRTYEIDDAMLDEYGLPTGQQVLGRAETLDQLREAIIDGSALTAYPQWVTDERMEQEASRADDISRPLSAAERNERVRRIIENPHLEGAERDDGVLQALAEQREELGLAEPAKQDDAPQVEYSQEPEVQSSADRDAAEIDYLFGREEMTEARAAAYDRFTGQELSPRTSQTAGAVQEPGQSQSQTRGRSR